MIMCPHPHIIQNFSRTILLKEIYCLSPNVRFDNDLRMDCFTKSWVLERNLKFSDTVTSCWLDISAVLSSTETICCDVLYFCWARCTPLVTLSGSLAAWELYRVFTLSSIVFESLTMVFAFSQSCSLSASLHSEKVTYIRYQYLQIQEMYTYLRWYL